MHDGAAPDASPRSQQQPMQIRVDESKMTTTYANTIRTTTTHDEVVLDFGLNMPTQQPGDQPPVALFSVGARVVLNWAGAKRFAASLARAVQGYEQEHGEIPLNA